MAEHMKFLRDHYAQNALVASGRKVPRTGGIILALGSSKEEIEEIMRHDPFCIQQFASFSITEFLYLTIPSAIEPFSFKKIDAKSCQPPNSSHNDGA